MKLLRLTCLFAIFLCFYQTIPSAGQTIFPHFYVKSSNPAFSRQVGEISEKAYQKASSYLNFQIPQKINMVITDDDSEFDRIVGEELPHWSIACAIPSRNLIVLKSPDRSQYRKSLEEVIYHEVAHIFLTGYLKDSTIPVWMNEGFAVWFSETWGWSEKLVVARAVLTGSIIQLPAVDSIWSFRESKAQLAYAQSFRAVSYLETEYQPGTFRLILSTYKDGESLDRAFFETIGLTYGGFQKEFEASLKSKYNWLGILTDSGMWWTALALIFILLYLLKRRRSRKIIQQWEKEDRGLAPKDSDSF